MKYQNKQNGKVMEIIKTDKASGSMIIRFEDGSTRTITPGTLKRWYKELPEAPETVENLIDLDNPVTEEEAEQLGMIGGDEALEQAVVDPEDAYVAEVMEQKKELGIDCPPITEIEIVEENAGDGTPLTEVGKEIAEQAKEKAEQAKKEKKERKPRQTKPANPEVDTIIDFIETEVMKAGGETFAPEKAPKVRAFKIDGHMFARINISKTSVSLCVRSKAIKVKEAPDKTQNHIFDAIYVLTDLSKTDLICALLHQSFGYQKSKNTKKEEK